MKVDTINKPTKKKSYVLKQDEEFVDYRYYDIEDENGNKTGKKKRVKVIKRVEKKVKILTEE